MSLLRTRVGQRAAVFLLVLFLVWLVAGIAAGSAGVGFAAGLIAAVFATGAAELHVRRDGSWTLVRRR
jgi:hypothetical protein